MVSLGTPLENGEAMKPSPSGELNPNMLVRDVERMLPGTKERLHDTSGIPETLPVNTPLHPVNTPLHPVNTPLHTVNTTQAPKKGSLAIRERVHISS